jgi:hypothetical protein
MTNKTFDSSAENVFPGNCPRDRHQNEVSNAIGRWKANLKTNWFPILLGAVTISFLLGYLIARQRATKKREQWAKILLGQAKEWLTDRSRKTAGSLEHGLEYARSVAEQAAAKGAECRRRLNPYHRENRFLGIL